jgi:two-component system sensor histidine kinase KdpD
MRKLSRIAGQQLEWSRTQFLGHSFIGCWVVALLTFSGWVLHFNSASMGFLFLLVVVSMAILCGFWQATIVSLLACGCLDYFFYPPVLQLTISDPQDWVALGAFEISALVVSRVSSREQRSSREVVLQRTAMEQLYELSRSTLLINLHQNPGPQLLQLIQRIFAAKAVAIFDAESGCSEWIGDWEEGERDCARDCFLLNASDDERGTSTWRRPLRIGARTTGAIAIRGSLNPLIVDALAALTALALDRFVSFTKESSIEAAHKSERLRAAVLDSLAHAVKTPLTAIQAASEGLSSVGEMNEAQRELSLLIDSEINQLSNLCTKLLQTARLEADEISLGKDEIAVSELVADALKRQNGHMAGHPVEVSVPDPAITVRGDAELLAMALSQYLDNAAKYSFQDTPIRVTAQASHAEVLISVHNRGPSIPIDERERIFQRFYRCDAARKMAKGTGIGLSTVRMAADAHQGHAWVISDAQEGTSFYLSLPQAGRRSH